MAVGLSSISSHVLYLLTTSDRTRGKSLKLCQVRLRLNIRKNFFIKRVVNIGTRCPGQWLSHWRYLNHMQMRCFGTWFSGRLGNARLTVKVDDLRALFHPKLFHDSIL